MWANKQAASRARERPTALVMLMMRLDLEGETLDAWHCFCLVHDTVADAMRGTHDGDLEVADYCPYQVVAGRRYQLVPCTDVVARAAVLPSSASHAGVIPRLLGTT